MYRSTHYDAMPHHAVPCLVQCYPASALLVGYKLCKSVSSLRNVMFALLTVRGTKNQHAAEGWL